MFFGKILGAIFGYMAFGLIGALLGALLGHQFDKGMAGGRFADLGIGTADRATVQRVFFDSAFAVMGAIAKADGRVTPDEIRLAETVMRHLNLDGERRARAIAEFNRGKSPGFDLAGELRQLRVHLGRQVMLRQMFVEIQAQIALVDGTLDETEHRILLAVCDALDYPRAAFERLVSMLQAGAGFGGAGAGQAGAAPKPRGPTLEQAYAILGVPASATDAEVKRAYRKLLSQHHPDKLAARGVPEEMIKLANEKTHEIRQAWELIQRERG